VDELKGDLVERAKYFGTLTELGVPRELFTAPRAVATPPVNVNVPVPVPGSLAVPVAAAAAQPGAPAATLTAIREEIGDCQRCKLAPTRKTIVFGQGSPSADLMFIGEAPGADEDEQGLAFVGKAGQLLTRIIEAMGLRRDDVFIANILKCRPPNNRNPEPDEILACQGFLDQQVASIRPRVIVALGKFAGQWLLKTADPISRIRGRLGAYNGIPVMPTYHPAYLLRTPSAKKDVWEDMKAVRGMLGLE
jgi:uracil-DNA glycosylase